MLSTRGSLGINKIKMDMAKEVVPDLYNGPWHEMSKSYALVLMDLSEVQLI